MQLSVFAGESASWSRLPHSPLPVGPTRTAGGTQGRLAGIPKASHPRMVQTRGFGSGCTGRESESEAEAVVHSQNLKLLPRAAFEISVCTEDSDAPRECVLGCVLCAEDISSLHDEM